MSNASADIPEEPHGASLPAPDHHVNYFAVFGILVVLTIITVTATFIGPFAQTTRQRRSEKPRRYWYRHQHA